MATPAKQMCCVTIGYREYLMPADKGMKLVELMQSAVECEHEFGRLGGTYVVGDQPDIQFCLVKRTQIRVPEGYVHPMPARLTSTPRLLK